MSLKFALFLIIHIFVVIFFLETLHRIVKRNNEYRLKDSEKTLPFTFVRLKHVVILYVILYLIWVVFSIFIYFYYINPHFSSKYIEKVNNNNIELNL